MCQAAGSPRSLTSASDRPHSHNAWSPWLVGSPLLTLRARIRFHEGACRDLDIERWLAEADDVDHRLLERVQGPVIDIGCGPGRHVEALTTRQVDALGIDLSRD